MKFSAFFLGLAVAVGGAVAVVAQERPARARPQADVFSFRVDEGGQLGIRVSDTTSGVRVEDVTADSPAARAGIREGDLVVEFDGERVRGAMQLTRLVRETPDGRQVAVAVMRDGKRQTLQATPEARAFGDGSRPRRFEVRPFMRSRERLGVTVQPLTRDLEEYFGATSGGALVSSVAANSAAARAGIRAGDVITSINGRRVRDLDDLTRELDDLTGDVTIVVVRDKKAMTLKGSIGRE